MIVCWGTPSMIPSDNEKKIKILKKTRQKFCISYQIEFDLKMVKIYYKERKFVCKSHQMDFF